MLLNHKTSYGRSMEDGGSLAKTLKESGQDDVGGIAVFVNKFDEEVVKSMCERRLKQ